MAIRAAVLIFDAPLWWVFPDLFLFGVELRGNELGEDATTVWLPAGIIGDAMAPPDPGRVGSVVVPLQL